MRYATHFIIFSLGLLLGAVFITYFPLQKQQATSGTTAIESIFSPDAKGEILAAIDSAKTSLDVEMYLFKYQTLADELVAAKGRGVKVRVLLEPNLSGGNPNLETMSYLRGHGIEARWSTPSRTNHAKFFIIDGKRVAVGSHNWSFSAMTKNREASVLVEDARTTAEFQQAFEQDWALATNN